MSLAKTKRALQAPCAPLSPPPDQVGKPSYCDPIGAPVVGELVSWTLTVEFRATKEDAHGRDLIEHVKDYLRGRGFNVGEPRMIIAARKIPYGYPPAPNRQS